MKKKEENLKKGGIFGIRSFFTRDEGSRFSKNNAPRSERGGLLKKKTLKRKRGEKEDKNGSDGFPRNRMYMNTTIASRRGERPIDSKGNVSSHIQCDKWAAVVRAYDDFILAIWSSSNKQSRTPIELIKYIGKTHDASHIALALLGSHAMFPNNLKRSEPMAELCRYSPYEYSHSSGLSSKELMPPASTL
ncbi:hypothetical protein VNO77_02443 [Canavalia gladiata]|uniref:Uncharacterized protein n=1 Tax=Canavalia gladiata TaxID=3824 RepID=A0AAN9MT99_CANGL